ncbi:ATPase inhibitor subunit zeta [Rhizobium tibeticum]|uniref:ATPase inhibitor subunit zeta n=1 Tax=Rhizobium tibeticum TaxID=501024 RepID=UPI00351F8570
MASLRIDVMRMVRRNKLVGMWAAEKLALADENAKSYSDELARGAVDVKRNDIHNSKRLRRGRCDSIKRRYSGCYEPLLAGGWKSNRDVGCQ